MVSYMETFLGPVHTRSQVQVSTHLRSIHAISTIESIEHGVPSPRTKSMTWMLTCQRFLKVRLGTCVESWVEEKLVPILNTSAVVFLA